MRYLLYGMDRWQSVALLVLALLFSTAGAADSQVGEISLSSLGTDETSYDPGSEVRIEANAENVVDEPQAGLTAEISVLWASSRDPGADHTTVHTEERAFDLPPEGAETLAFTWPVPPQAAPGEYRVFLEVRNENGQPQAVRSRWFSVNDTGQETRAIAIERIAFRQGSRQAAGTYGMHVKRNRSMNITVHLNNTGDRDIAPAVAADFQFTYDRDRVAKTVSTSATIPAGTARQVTLTTTPPDTPTTYTPKITVSEGEETLAQGRGRIVVEGASARILDVSPSKLAYEAGEDIEMEINVIGPADYSGTLEDVSLRFEVDGPEGEVLSGEREVDIPAATRTVTVSSPVEENLESYNVSVSLRKDGNVLDSWETSYTGGSVAASTSSLPATAVVVLVLLALAGLGWWYRNEL